MSLEENKAIVRKMFEATNKRNLAVFNEFVDEFAAVDVVDHTSQGEVQGREHWKQACAMVLQEYPDLLETIEDIIAEGDKVWIRFEVTGTHGGVYRGLAPTGKKFTIRAVSIYRIVDSKVVEREAIYDMLDFYKLAIDYSTDVKGCCIHLLARRVCPCHFRKNPNLIPFSNDVFDSFK